MGHSSKFSLITPNTYKFFVWLSVCLLAYILTEVRLKLWSIQFGLIYPPDKFWKSFHTSFSLNVLTMWYLPFWMRHLSDVFFWKTIWILVHYIQLLETWCVTVSLFVGWFWYRNWANNCTYTGKNDMSFWTVLKIFLG